VELYLHPQYAFMAWCSVKKKAQDNFTFTTVNPMTKTKEQKRQERLNY
jgi:hypothetical protein